MDDLMLQLQAPFDDRDIEWRAQKSGFAKNGKAWAILLAYITNRAIQERLDITVGIKNWRNEYDKAPDGGVMCGLSLRFENEWVTKWDGAENTSYEPVKGGLSSSMKRAAVQWGIGRYLYDLDINIVTLFEEKQNAADLMVMVKRDSNDKFGVKMFCPRPGLPEWALPSPTGLDDLHKKIRALGKALNHPSSVTESRIKQATTIHDAQEAVDDLERRLGK